MTFVFHDIYRVFIAFRVLASSLDSLGFEIAFDQALQIQRTVPIEPTPS